MVGVCVWSIVQNHRFSKVPLKYAQILDIVPKNTGTVLLIQTVSTKEDISYVHDIYSVYKRRYQLYTFKVQPNINWNLFLKLFKVDEIVSLSLVHRTLQLQYHYNNTAKQALQKDSNQSKTNVTSHTETAFFLGPRCPVFSLHILSLQMYKQTSAKNTFESFN